MYCQLLNCDDITPARTCQKIHILYLNIHKKNRTYVRQNTSVRLILHIYKSTEIPENPLAETANVWYNTKTVSMPSIRLGVYVFTSHIHSGIVERQLNNAVGAVFMSAPIRPIFSCDLIIA